MFPLLGAEGCTQQQKIPAIPLYGCVNNSSENLQSNQSVSDCAEMTTRKWECGIKVAARAKQ